MNADAPRTRIVILSGLLLSSPLIATIAIILANAGWQGLLTVIAFFACFLFVLYLLTGQWLNRPPRH